MKKLHALSWRAQRIGTESGKNILDIHVHLRSSVDAFS
jgi:hypothetical protein